ncbi:MAG: hypothetical protein K8S98_04515 [Planctomycetes bacterium]|nr:hypothetical protein [Planctomycetota bacterium]
MNATFLCALLAFAQAPREEPTHALPVSHAGLVVLRGGERAPLPDEVAALKPLRIVLGSTSDEHELALVPNDWIADAPTTVARLQSAEAFEFRDGSPYRLLEALYPKKSESRAAQVLRERHRLGAPVIGTGRGAGFVSALTFAAVAERERRERNPRRTDSLVSLWSLSILPWAAVVTDVETGGDLEPLYAALVESHLDAAFFLGETSTVAVDLVRGDARAYGDSGALLFDLSRARRDRSGFSEGRLACLFAGDVWDVRTRRATLAPGAELAPERALDDLLEVEHSMTSASLRAALARLLESPLPRSLRVVGKDAVLTFTSDEDTRFAARGGGVLALAGMRVDVRFGPGHTRP